MGLCATRPKTQEPEVPRTPVCGPTPPQSPSRPEKEPAFLFKCVGVQDGDTFDCVPQVQTFIPDERARKMIMEMLVERVRMLHIDAPETKLHKEFPCSEKHKKAGLLVKHFVEVALDGQIFELNATGKRKRDMYGRLLAEVVIAESGVNLNQLMLDKKIAKPCCEKRTLWTEDELDRVIATLEGY